MAKTYNPDGTDWTRPAQGAFTITAGASALSHTIRGIFVGVSGNVTVTLPSGDSVQFTNLAAGVVHPIAATHVTAATATGIVGVY
jgi:hypothetical protein